MTGWMMSWDNQERSGFIWRMLASRRLEEFVEPKKRMVDRALRRAIAVKPIAPVL
jgi:hypothetical protein